MTAAATVDFDLFGIAGVRLFDAQPADVDAVARQLQCKPDTLRREPELRIRFVPAIERPALRYLGLNWAACDDDSFYLLDERSGEIQCALPFDTLATGGELLCRSSLGGVPLLPDIVGLSICRKGYVALHASAFRHADRGVLVLGWEKGGKTEALLAFASRGAQFVGDETVFLSADGRQMFGLPRPIAVWDWQAEQVAGLIPRAGATQRLTFATIRALDRLHRRFGTRRSMRLLHKAMPTLRRQRKSWHLPNALFDEPLYDAPCSVDRVFLMTSHASEGIDLVPCDAQRVAAAMAASNDYERTHVMQYYRGFRFAFVERSDPFLESIDTRQAEMLHTALDKHSIGEIRHPYPVSLAELYESMLPSIKGEG